MITLVIGCAEGVWDEVAAAQAIVPKFDAICCVKAAGIHWPHKFDVWATLHPEHMKKMREERAALGYPNGYRVVTAKEISKPNMKIPVDEHVSMRWYEKQGSGSSGFLGMKYYVDAGSKVVLAGVPMDGRSHFLRNAPWKEGAAKVYVDAWVNNYARMKPVVRSMSGFTQKLLGAPTTEWATS